ncbi:hypothetical protein BDW22DRAFT_1101698 [Trametopsis cervina]|nr:hypothetical protein BDW22DRAFT_1101698 [Trametopsis cervina]
MSKPLWYARLNSFEFVASLLASSMSLVNVTFCTRITKQHARRGILSQFTDMELITATRDIHTSLPYSLCLRYRFLPHVFIADSFLSSPQRTRFPRALMTPLSFRRLDFV